MGDRSLAATKSTQGGTEWETIGTRLQGVKSGSKGRTVRSYVRARRLPSAPAPVVAARRPGKPWRARVAAGRPVWVNYDVARSILLLTNLSVSLSRKHT
jgi:hypothetical protein